MLCTYTSILQKVNKLEYLKIKNLITEQGLITATKSKKTRNNILT